MSETKPTTKAAKAAPAASTEAKAVSSGLVLKVKRLNPNAVLPSYATDGSGCFDLSACLPTADGITVGPSNPRTFDTGLSFEVPQGWAMLVFSRSGHGFKNDVRLSNCVGVIDSDYRGEVKVKLTQDPGRNSETMIVHHGDRIAQAMLIRTEKVEFVEVDGLSETARGEGGFGSTGV